MVESRLMPKSIITDDEILQAALLGLQHSLTEVEGKIAELRRKLGGRGTNSRSKAAAGSNHASTAHQMSAAARERIAAAQKKRWAAFRRAHQN